MDCKKSCSKYDAQFKRKVDGVLNHEYQWGNSDSSPKHRLGGGEESKKSNSCHCSLIISPVVPSAGSCCCPLVLLVPQAPRFLVIPLMNMEEGKTSLGFRRLNI